MPVLRELNPKRLAIAAFGFSSGVAKSEHQAIGNNAIFIAMLTFCVFVFDLNGRLEKRQCRPLDSGCGLVRIIHADSLCQAHND